MAPKSENVARRKKGAKGKTSDVDVLSAEEMTKEQLEEHVIRLREELEREREEKSFFQLERDKIQSLWEVSKRHLEETRAQLANRGREDDDAERRHRVEISVYKQKLKHVLSEQTAAGKKTDGAAAAWLARRRHADTELHLRRNGQNLQADARRHKLAGHKCIRELQLKHQVELMELGNEYEKRIAEAEAKYGDKMEQLRRAEADKTRAAILALDDKMSRRLGSLSDEQRQKFPAAREFFGSAQSRLARDGKALKDQARASGTQQALGRARLDAADKRHAALAASLQRARRNLPELRRRLEGHRRARGQQAAGAARVQRLEEQLEDVLLERDLLVAAFAQVEEERDALLSKQTQVLLEVQQRSGLKEMLLERKMALLSRRLDGKEACDGDTAPETRLRSKRDAIGTLQQDLRRQCQEYDALAETCRRRLDALGVPSDDFPLADVLGH